MATAVLVRWLRGSFAFFSVGLCCWEKANVPPKAVAHFQVKCLSGMGRQIPFYFQIVVVRCPATNIFQGLLSFFLSSVFYLDQMSLTFVTKFTT